MVWRRIRYGPHRPEALYAVAREVLHPSSPFLDFWRRVNNQSIKYFVQIDTRSRVFAIRFSSTVFGDIILDFSNTKELIFRMASYSLTFEPGYDFEALMKFDGDTDHWFLDTSSVDNIKRKPRPAHAVEVKNNPTWVQVPNVREKLGEKYFTQEERDYFAKCHNTFEVHASDLEQLEPEKQQEIRDLQEEKFKSLSELWHEDETVLSDEAWNRLLGYTILDVTEFDDNCEVKDMVVPFSYADLCMVGCKNSAKGGMSYSKPLVREKEGELRVNECKTTTNIPASNEALRLLHKASTEQTVTIRPHTMNPKDERNKPGKKEKMFNALDHCYGKYDLLVNGSHGDRAQKNRS